MNPKIRNEVSTDVHAIDAVTTAAFLTARHTAHTEQFIVKALRKTGKLTISLVAEVDADVVGHVAISPVTISGAFLGWYGLGPISVAPAYQGQGIGSHLVVEALRALRERQACGCVVLGEPAYYSRFGFRAGPGFVLPDVPPEYFQALSFDEAMPSGVVSYDESFNARA